MELGMGASSDLSLVELLASFTVLVTSSVAGTTSFAEPAPPSCSQEAFV
jgi:hypothetical protein